MEIGELRTKLVTAYTDGSTDEVVADLEAQLATAKQTAQKAKAESDRAEVAAKQAERLAITEGCKDWVKYCKKNNMPVITVNEDSLEIATAVMELVKAQPNIIDRVRAAKGLALQYKPADEASDIARCLVTITATKAAKKGGNGGNRGGKLIALFDQHATADEKAALELAVSTHKAAGGQRSDSIEYKHRVQVKKRLLDAGLITAE